MIKKYYRLPDGKYTTSQNKYLRNYRRLAKPICSLFKEESKYGYSFDPGLLLLQLRLSGDQAMKIYKLITRKDFISK